jgi:S1-C subfamily serine protease
MRLNTLIRSLPVVGTVLVIAGALSMLKPTEAQTPVPVPVPTPGPVPVPVPVTNQGSLGFSATLIPGLGLRVNYTFPFSPARRIGLEPGDVIILVNGVRINSMATYQYVLASSGGSVDLVIRNIRNGRPLIIPRVPLEPPAFDGYKPRASSAPRSSPSQSPRRTTAFLPTQQEQAQFA